MTASTPLKLHLRLLEIGRRQIRVVTLRPSCGVSFSTNYFHDTWHILVGPDGTALLARLFWGLAFQRHRDTLILIDHPHLVSTPFDGDPSDPILLVPDQLTHIDDDLLRELKHRMRRPPHPTTIRWHTFGMPVSSKNTARNWRDLHGKPIWLRERMTRRAGFVCYTAPPAILRLQAELIHRMRSDDYHYLAENHPGAIRGDGEVQAIPHFATRVAAARAIRRQLRPDARGWLAGTDDAYAIDCGVEATLRRRRLARRS
jgi:hypothetical protein